MAGAPWPDVVVVGAGAAGLAAAIEAAEAGAAVRVLDAGAEPGGSSAMSAAVFYAAGTSVQRAAGVTDSPDAMFAYYMTFNQWNVEPWLVRRLCDEAALTLEWLVDLGVKYPVEQLYVAGVDGVPRGHKAAGGGAAMVAALLARAGELGVEVRTGTRVAALLTARDRVTGVRTDRGEDVQASAVVLASGGLGANTALLAELYPAAAEREPGWPGYFGCPTNHGDGLVMARAAGAAVVGRGRGLVNWTTRFSGDEPSDFAPSWIVFVNTDGRRFMSETAPYAVAGDLLLAQPGRRAFAVLDEAARASSGHDNARMAHLGVGVYPWAAATIAEQAEKGVVHRAGSLEELAVLAGIRPRALRATIESYNADAARGVDRRFLKTGELRPITTPPFYAVEIRPSSYGITAAGVAIDPDAQVRDVDDVPIPGLFAAGEVAGGVFGDRYAGGGNAIANAVVFGRIAGRNAAALTQR